MAKQLSSSQAFGLKLNHAEVRFKHLLKPYRLDLFFGCWLLLITNLIMVSLPILINGGVTLIENGQAFGLNLIFFRITFLNIYWVLISIVSLALLGALIRTVSRMVLFEVGRSVERDIRSRLFFQLTAQDDEFFLKNSVGDLMNHLTTDVSNIRMVTGFAALNIMNIIFIFCFTIPLMLKIDLALALCALLPFPLVMLAMSRITKKMFLATINYQEKQSNLANHIQENLLGAQIIRLFHQQQQESDRFSLTNKDIYDAGVGLAKVRALMFPIMRFLVGLSVVLVLYVGGRAILFNQLTLGDFVEINARILQLAWPAMSVGFVMSIYSRGRASLMRINQLLAQKPNIGDGQKNLGPVNELTVNGLKLNELLRDDKGISFSLKRGQFMGIVGQSGSYKTKLLRALYRREMIPMGTIFLNGHDINDLSLSSIYDQVSVVSSETFLFHKTIRENIIFLQPHASEHDIDVVIKILSLDRDIANFKDGLDTVIGERGITLSGGQRQRIALARLLLAKKSINILDDALSAVDAQTERNIVVHLKEYLKDSMVIIASHRLSAIEGADHILVLEHGRVVEEGNHLHLVKVSPLYQSLWGIDQLTERLI